MKLYVFRIVMKDGKIEFYVQDEPCTYHLEHATFYGQPENLESMKEVCEDIFNNLSQYERYEDNLDRVEFLKLNITTEISLQYSNQP